MFTRDGVCAAHSEYLFIQEEHRSFKVKEQGAPPRGCAPCFMRWGHQTYGKMGTTLSESVTIGNAVCEFGMAILAVEHRLLVTIMTCGAGDGPQV